VSAGASAFEKPPFPRTAGMNVGGPFNYNDQTYQANLARLNMVVLNTFPGAMPGGLPLNTAVQAIKAKNPKELVFVYVNSNELVNPGGGPAWDTLRGKVDSMKWWLYSDAAMTSRVKSQFGTDYYIINNTQLTPRDSAGNTSIEWITKFFIDSYYKPNPVIDGFFMDNTFWHPNVDGDWTRTGKVVSGSDPQAGTWLRQGYARYYTLARSLMPGKYQIGNIGDWGDPASAVTEYQGLLNGGLMEGYIGKSWSIENWIGWNLMMDRYRKVMSTLAEPKLAIFGQWGDPNDYQAMRYGLGSCLLGDAYYSFTDTSKGYYGFTWFDEYDSNLGAGSTTPTAAWSNGVWRRDFDNGIVLVNPKGNGPKTVTLEADFVKIKGVQDPGTNNGQVVRTVTLKDRDGIILLRKSPVKRPKAPQKISIQP
jgi:hypothetical protein